MCYKCIFHKIFLINCGENKLLKNLNVDGRKQRDLEKRKMQANDRQEQKVARRTYMAHALLTALVVNITWLVDVSVRLLVYLDIITFLSWFKL